MSKNDNNIIIYQDEDGITKVGVKFVDEDIWLNKYQIAEIYKTTRQNIEQHINKIYKDEELKIDLTCKNFLQVKKEGSRQVKRNIDHYNLDMIIALGYRVQTRKLCVLFRKERKCNVSDTTMCPEIQNGCIFSLQLMEYSIRDSVLVII